jgi:Fe2+ transport system protein FeoA
MANPNLERNEESVVSLSRLSPGQSGRIVRVNGPAAARLRLLEMGLVRGETISVERVAPLGDPVEFTIKGYHLSLRRQNTANIYVVISTDGEVEP